MKDSFTVHDLPLSERPRERLLKLGGEALSAQEILALILGRGIRGESVMVTSQRLLSKFGNLKGIASASIEELTQINGIGLAIKSPEDVANIVRSQLKGKKREHFLVLCLDTRNRLINCRPVSMGSLDTSVVHPREAFKEAVSSSAASVIFVHNHPSGDPEPSKEDIELTKRLAEAGKIVGIEVLDHIIVCDKDYLSLKAKNFFRL